MKRPLFCSSFPSTFCPPFGDSPYRSAHQRLARRREYLLPLDGEVITILWGYTYTMLLEARLLNTYLHRHTSD